MFCQQSLLGFGLPAFFLTAGTSVAIPSPELVIGSVTSLSQIFGIALATITGAGAHTAKRFGINATGHATTFFKYFLLILCAICIILTLLNFWQYQHRKTTELVRLQQTLVRPAQFDGSSIKDANLVETSFTNQISSPLAISTELATKLSETPKGAMFIDVREDGEHAMGTLPGATHIRFPDISVDKMRALKQPLVLFCHNGNRSSETCEKLAALGIDCKFIAGGIERWLV